MYYFKIKFFFSKESAFMSLLFLKREYGIFEKKTKKTTTIFQSESKGDYSYSTTPSKKS